MAQYLETAKRYNQLPVELLALVPDEHKDRACELIARLVNAGMVGNPRPAQGTVRLNYVSEVCRHIPVKCGLEERRVKPDDPTDTRTYKALTVQIVKKS